MCRTLLPWPEWPEYRKSTLDAASIALMAGRWAISGPTTVFPSYEKVFAEEYTSFIGCKYCVPTANGSSAIVIALQALGIGPGDKVLLPATTWVGCATSVLRVGATPVFLDTNLNSLCFDLENMDDLGDERIAAVLAIHTYASYLDISRIRYIFPGIPVIEDCSHCHGAKLPDNKRYGSFGDIAVFSFQASKLLTSGEGGAALTDNEDLYNAMISLRADSRRYRKVSPESRALGLAPSGSLHGANYCLSELQASVLLEQMERLDEQNSLRAKNLKLFKQKVENAPIKLIHDNSALEHGAFYGLPICISDSVLEKQNIDAIIDMIFQQCGLKCDRIYPPVPESPLYKPQTIALYRNVTITNPQKSYSHATKAYSSVVFVPHFAFLANEELLERFSDSLLSLGGKISRNFQTNYDAEGVIDYPEVTVIILTKDRLDLLLRAVASVSEQDYVGRINVLIIGDNCPSLKSSILKEKFPQLHLRFINLTGDLFYGTSTLERIARMRNLALSQAKSELIAFLDDDNRWAPNHLRSLCEKMIETGCPAVHSWRLLVDSNAQPIIVDSFPWIPDQSKAIERFEILVRLGMMFKDSGVVHDRYVAIYNGTDYGMVDCGEWLFRRSILQLIGFQTNFSTSDEIEMVGEDDKLLLDFKKRRVPAACTEMPTLFYTLGGISNHFFERKSS